MLEKRIIEIAPLAFMRGRTLSDAFIILDEAQNTTSEQMKMFLTRIGFGSKAVVTGDKTQIDLPRGQKSGLKEAEVVLADIDAIEFVYFTDKDVVRHKLVQMIVKAYEDSFESVRGVGMIDVINLQRKVKLETAVYRKYVKELSSSVDEANGKTFSVAFVSDDRMWKLNWSFRGKDSTTDVLSFPHEADEFEQSSPPYKGGVDAFPRTGWFSHQTIHCPLTTVLCPLHFWVTLSSQPTKRSKPTNS